MSVAKPEDTFSGPERRRFGGRRLGLRTEVLILLPVTTLLLIVLSTFTLFAYRSTLQLLIDDRQAEAMRWARQLATTIAADPRLTAEALRRITPLVRGVAVLESGGAPLEQSGALPDGDLLAPLRRGPGAAAPREATALGPSEPLLPDVVAGFAPVGPASTGRWLRVDLSAPTLAAQRRSVAILSVVILTMNAGLGLLLVVFLRHVLAPYEGLLARARQASGLQAIAKGEDEVAFLVTTFERALAALAKREGEPEGDEIAILERALAPGLKSGLLLVGHAGEVLALNPVGARLLGIDVPAPRTPLTDVLAPHPELMQVLSEVVTLERGLQRHELVIAAAGTQRLLGLTAHPLRRDDETARGYLVLFTDLTQARRAEEEAYLSESLRQLGELAAGVAHELRNSLATLRGYLTLIERRPTPEMVADYLLEIRREAEQLQRVLEDFLTFAQPGTARLEEVDLEQIARRAAADPALEGIPVIVNPLATVSGGGARLLADGQLLEHALRNLVRNAAQAERESGGPGIEIDLARTAEGLEIQIDDHGPGLPPQVRERLFQPFTAGRAGGVGLGLAVTRRIVDLHRGHVTLDDRPGGGTRAKVILPTVPNN